MLAANETVTIYNQVLDGDVESYPCTVISGVSWYAQHLYQAGAAGLQSARVVKIRIPEAAPGKIYAAPLDWAAAPDRTALWTLQPGDKIARGEHDAVTPAQWAKLSQLYDDVVVIVGVNDNRRGITPHWTVTAR